VINHPSIRLLRFIDEALKCKFDFGARFGTFECIAYRFERETEELTSDREKGQGRETQIYRGVNYETTCLMTWSDPARCKFSTRG